MWPGNKTRAVSNAATRVGIKMQAHSPQVLQLIQGTSCNKRPKHSTHLHVEREREKERETGGERDVLIQGLLSIIFWATCYIGTGSKLQGVSSESYCMHSEH